MPTRSAYAEELENSSVVESLGAEEQVESAESATEDISTFFSGINSIVGSIGALASGAFAGFMIFVLTIYFMIYGRDIRRGIGARLGAERGPRFAHDRGSMTPRGRTGTGSS